MHQLRGAQRGPELNGRKAGPSQCLSLALAPLRPRKYLIFIGQLDDPLEARRPKRCTDPGVDQR